MRQSTVVPRKTEISTTLLTDYITMRKSKRRCVVINCETTSDDPKKSFFAFPKDITRKQIWIDNLKIDHNKDLYSQAVCQDHFEKNHFSNLQKTRLKTTAVPTALYHHQPKPSLRNLLLPTTKHTNSTLCLFCRREVGKIPPSAAKTCENIYEQLFDCCKQYLKKGDNKSSFNWTYSIESPSPYCQICLKLSKDIYQINEQLTGLKKVLMSLIQKFRYQINLPREANTEDENSYVDDVKDEVGSEDSYIKEEAESSVNNADEVESSFQLDVSLGTEFNSDGEGEPEITDPLESADSDTSNNNNVNSPTPEFNSDGEDNPEIADPLESADSCNSNNNNVNIHTPEFNSDGEDNPEIADPLESADSCNSDNKNVNSPTPKFNSDGQPGKDNPEIADPLESADSCNSNNNNANNITPWPRVLLERLDSKMERLFAPGLARTVSSLLSRKSALETYMSRKVRIASKKYSKVYRTQVDSISGIRELQLSSNSEYSLAWFQDANLPAEGFKLINVLLLCDVCQQPCTNIPSLLEHKKTHVGGVRFACAVCSGVFADARSLSVHLVSKHQYSSKQRKLICDICGMKVFKISTFVKHRLSHNGKDEKPFHCCGRSYNSQLVYKNHSSAAHSGKKYPCNFCGKTFNRKDSLYKHIPTHRKDSPFQCLQCEKRFKTRSSLILHKRNIHEGKKFKCFICFKTFSSNRYLAVHKKYNHMNMTRERKMFTCEDCGKGYATKKGLMLHRDSHHAENNSFECSVCKKMFSNQLYLQGHVKRVHGEKEFQCDTCGKRFGGSTFLNYHIKQVHTVEKLACKICGKMCTNKICLARHVRLVHISERKHICDTCGKRSATKVQLNRHIETIHQRLLKYKCSRCEKKFSNTANLKRHEETHKSESERLKYKCEICGDRYFTQSSGLRLHQSQYHTVYTGHFISCGQCNNKFFDGSEMFTHRRRLLKYKAKNSQGNREQCLFCQQLFLSRCDLYSHFATAHPSEKNPWECPVCHCVFNSSLILDIHTESNCWGKNLQVSDSMVVNAMCDNVQKGAGDDSITKLQCSTCNMEFLNRQDLILHKKKHCQLQNNHFQHLCLTCGERFEYSCKLTEHERVHTGEKPFGCKTCSKSYLRRRDLTRHQRRHHNKDSNATGAAKIARKRSYACQHCTKVYTVLANLKIHIRSAHTGEKPFKCKICEQSFAGRNRLVYHEFTHLEAKAFTCEICGRGCATPGNLRTHAKSHEAEREKKFLCTTCGMAFTQKCNLKKHERVHTGEKPFQCQYCEKSFAQSNTLKAHIPTHTGEKNYSCLICEKKFSDSSTLSKHKKTHTTQI